VPASAVDAYALVRAGRFRTELVTCSAGKAKDTRSSEGSPLPAFHGLVNCCEQRPTAAVRIHVTVGIEGFAVNGDGVSAAWPLWMGDLDFSASKMRV
jgi:hypothetical protein